MFLYFSVAWRSLEKVGYLFIKMKIYLLIKSYKPHGL